MNKLKAVGVIIDNEEVPFVQQYSTQGITQRAQCFLSNNMHNEW